MRRTLALALVIAACTAGVGAQAPDARRKHPVEAFFTSGVAAFNAHDLEGFMRQFAEDVEMYTPTGWLRGREGVRRRFADTFRQFPSVRMEVEGLRVREVARGVAVTDFRWRVYPMGRGPAFHGVGSGVYVRRGDAWAEVLEHETVVKVDEGLAPAKK